MKGNIFNIQKFSIHDGPGIRTTVFFKGCPLRCKWCANPESQSDRFHIIHDEKSCLKCGGCAWVCRQKCWSFENGAVSFNADNCIGCQSCVRSCPARAIKVEGEMTDSDRVVELCMQDAEFYEESGGGVTFSGGECMAQPDFCRELAMKLKAKGIHLAAETTGCIARDTFRSLAPLFDLLLFDVKHYDGEKHREGTGVDNALILENLRRAHENGINILPRIPVIPDFNNSLSDAAGIAELLSDIGLKRAQLLPFHQMGERKYGLLGRDYALKDVPALHREELEDYRKVFLDRGIECFF